jgi:phage-related protein
LREFRLSRANVSKVLRLHLNARSGMLSVQVRSRMETPRRLVWIGTSREDLKQFPDEVQDEMGYGLFLAQRGEKHHRAKPLRVFGGAATLEMISDYRSDTYRAVYTVGLSQAVYVLHAFQKKSKRGVSTPRAELNLIRQRLREAEAADAALD